MSQSLVDTDVETQLRTAVAEVLEDNPTKVDDLDGATVWSALRAMGATTLPVPEELGGQGAGWREVAVVAEELGRAVAPVPFLGSVLATAALLRATDDPHAAEALRGDATLVVPLSAWPGGPLPHITVDGDRLTGTVRSVADVRGTLVVPADGALWLTEQADITPVTSLDRTRPVADVEFSGAKAVRVAADGAVEHALRVGAAILAAEQVGIAEWCLDTTVAYLKQRYQFGRPVGSYQALKHRLADLWQEIVLARAAAKAAADALDTGEDAALLAYAAQSLCAEVAVHAAEECVQLHGGIGMTWEHPAHLYLKRAKADEIALGTPGRLRVLLAPLADLPA
ncbi:acyl-CoA dehydrogenase family protein [Actinokineospora fastidiosa]|uniref:Acyl-CoA dehydrogenase n=1 Tax=Actinokineospora fastidiosa TaxID=1816 RepID=A0A918GFA8_9PSEU|nr:acyl-CoA dehydrogenase family protein [Actinokineospora fastidiosa]GGS31844.1 acyl-CoA dehydrogenase [Actinokineospora fastidiosa]